MIKNFVLLILLPILITAVYLMTSDDNFVGIYALAIMLGGLFLTFMAGKPLCGILLTMIAMHWVQMDGMFVSLYLIFFVILLLFLRVSTNKEIRIDRKWWILAAWTFGYLALVFLIKPYHMRPAFFFMNFLAFLLFLTSSLIRWNSRRVFVFLTVDLIFMVTWAVVERFLSSAVRIEGPSMSSTNFAVTLVIAWSVWFINGFLVLKTKVLHLVLMTLGVMVAILLSGTRMGLLGLGTGLALAFLCKYIILYRNRVLDILMRVGIALVAVAILSVIVWNMLPDDLFLKQGMSTLLSGNLDSSSLGRIGAWLTALDIIHTDPLWGIGPGNFLERNKIFLDSITFLPRMDLVPRLGHAHNLFLMVLSEQGMIGLVSLGFVVLVCLKVLFSYIRIHCDGFGLALVCGLLLTLGLGMIDVFPLFPSSLGWGAWLMSVIFSLRGERGSRT